MSEWVEIIHENYYGWIGTTLQPDVLASEIAKAVTALGNIDTRKDNGSKLFDSKINLHYILAEAFLTGLLRYLASNNVEKTTSEWQSFFSDKVRQFNRSDWSLPYVISSGALSSTNGTISKQIAKDCFNAAFNDPKQLSGKIFTDFLNGQGSSFKVISYTTTSVGKKSSRQSLEVDTTPRNDITIDMNQGGYQRNIISVQSATPNLYITRVFDDHKKPPEELPDAKRNRGLNVLKYDLARGYEIMIETMSYGGDSRKTTGITLKK